MVFISLLLDSSREMASALVFELDGTSRVSVIDGCDTRTLAEADLGERIRLDSSSTEVVLGRAWLGEVILGVPNDGGGVVVELSKGFGGRWIIEERSYIIAQGACR